MENREIAAGLRDLAKRVGGARDRMLLHEAAKMVLNRGEFGLQYNGTVLTVADNQVVLTAREKTILQYLNRRAGVVAIEDIEAVVCPDAPPVHNSIQALIYRMRRKLEKTPIQIITHWGVGYELVRKEDHEFLTSDKKSDSGRRQWWWSARNTYRVRGAGRD